MPDRLKNSKKLVGVKQVMRALRDGAAACAYVAEDADPAVTRSVEELCSELGVELVRVPTMNELGAACGIEVGSAAAVLLK